MYFFNKKKVQVFYMMYLIYTILKMSISKNLLKQYKIYNSMHISEEVSYQVEH
jgi:hypothetical protein